MRIIVTGLIAQHPTLGGVAWDYLQFPLGLLQLGHDVFYLEDSGEWPYNLDGGPTKNDWIARDPTPNVEHLARTLSRYGLDENWSYRFPTEPRWFGMSDAKREEVIRTADLLLNVSGTLEHPEKYRAIPRLLYVDSDPVFTQIKIALPDRDFSARVAAHDVHFTFGEALTKESFRTDFNWIPIRQPIVLSEWKCLEPPRDVLTTVMSWTSYKPVTFSGVSYGQKDIEFCHFLDLPEKASPTQFEVAMNGTQHIDWQTGMEDLPPAAEQLFSERKDWMPAELLTRTGWRVVDAMQVCSGIDAYREYVQSSKGEWSVAKNGYVRGRSGWFSCRSACYLAAGRPVVLQDTGFSQVLPTGKGLFAFDSVEEAVAHIHAIESDYAAQSRAARQVAEEFFNARKVLTRLLEQATAS
jgi:hypothetical protein